MTRTGAILLLLMIPSLTSAGSLPFARMGTLDTPRADVLQHTQVAITGSFTAYSVSALTDTTATADTVSESDFAIAGNLEIGLFRRAQIGVTYLNSGGISGSVRGLLMNETITRPGIAVGCENLIGEENYEFYEAGGVLYEYPQSQNFSAYIVMTKNFDYFTGAPFCLNLGYGIGRFMQSGDYGEADGFTNPVPGLFFSIEFHPDMNSRVAIEWDGRDANLGGSYSINRHVRFLAAIAELEQLLRSGDANKLDVMQNPKFTLGVEFTIGPFLSRTHLDPTERLSDVRDEEAYRALEESRARAREQIEELLETMD